MGRGIIFDGGVFFEWSTVVDAPVTSAMTREQMRDCRLRMYGEIERDNIEQSLRRAETTGSSFIHGLGIADIAAFNRAGPNEKHLPWPEVLALVKAADDDLPTASESTVPPVPGVGR